MCTYQSRSDTSGDCYVFLQTLSTLFDLICAEESALFSAVALSSPQENKCYMIGLYFCLIFPSVYSCAE